MDPVTGTRAAAVVACRFDKLVFLRLLLGGLPSVHVTAPAPEATGGVVLFAAAAAALRDADSGGALCASGERRLTKELARDNNEWRDVDWSDERDERDSG